MEAISSEQKRYAAKSKKYYFSSISLCILSLLLLSLLSIKLYSPGSYDQFSNFNAYIAIAAHFIILIFTFKIYKNAAKEERKIWLWLVWINIGLFLDDTAFFFLVYMHDIRFFNSRLFIYLLDLTPAFIWFIASITFLSRLLLAEAVSFKRLLKVLLPFFVVNFMMIYLLLSATNFAFALFSWQNIAHIPTIIAHFLIFDLAILCLIYSKRKGLSFFFIGLTVLVSGDIFIIYSSLSQTHHVLAYGELLWTLGLLFMLRGMQTIENMEHYHPLKNWCNQTNV